MGNRVLAHIVAGKSKGETSSTPPNVWASIPTNGRAAREQRRDQSPDDGGQAWP